MAASPILPRSLSSPQGVAIDRLERKAIADFKRRIKRCLAAYQDLLGRIDFERFTVNAEAYTFRTDPSVLLDMISQTGTLIDQILLEGGDRNLWFLSYTTPATAAGTAQAWTNIGVQSTAYKLSRPTLESVLLSEPYQKRLGLVRAREFELMKGLSATVKQQMAQTLTAGMAQGIGPREIAKNLTAQAGVEERRANLIARTEVSQAHREARLSETQDAVQRLDIKVAVMHLSALSPTTRPDHAARHGVLTTVQGEKDWYAAKPGRPCNCKCSQTEVLLNDDGSPLSQKLVDRVRAARDRWEAAQD